MHEKQWDAAATNKNEDVMWETSSLFIYLVNCEKINVH